MLSLLASLALVALPAQDADGLVMREVVTHVMGTSLEVRVLGHDADELDAALAAAVTEMERVEDLMTDWRPSPLTRLNAEAGNGPQVVPAELARLVARALQIGELTGGAFDITYAGAGKLWDFKRDPPLLPDAARIAAALAVVDYRTVHVDLDANTVELPAGARIGLGGIAKGYGVDRAMQVLLDHGVKHGMVNAGGDLKALGKRFGKPWEIAIRHPRDREHVVASLPVANTCVVTSGDYERFFEYEGKRYHHILDPRTGYPSTGCMSTTVVAPDAAFADALATALCVIGSEAGMELVESLDRVEALLVDLDGNVTVSSGLRGDKR